MREVSSHGGLLLPQDSLETKMKEINRNKTEYKICFFLFFFLFFSKKKRI